MSKIFYEYYRKNGKLKGVMVAMDKDVYGWSMCDSKDLFDKDKGVSIAYNRAIKAASMSPSERDVFYNKVPTSMRSLFSKTIERAKKYYK